MEDFRMEKAIGVGLTVTYITSQNRPKTTSKADNALSNTVSQADSMRRGHCERVVENMFRLKKTDSYCNSEGWKPQCMQRYSHSTERL